MATKTIILQPVISEKSYRLSQEENVFTFLVNPQATKIEVKNAVQDRFNVKVTDVKTIKLKGKRVRFGYSRKLGKRSDYKKALVKLQEGDKIEVFNV